MRLRIEDHDRERSRPEFERSILDDLEWLGFVPDVPPLRGSVRGLATVARATIRSDTKKRSRGSTATGAFTLRGSRILAHGLGAFGEGGARLLGGARARGALGWRSRGARA